MLPEGHRPSAHRAAEPQENKSTISHSLALQVAEPQENKSTISHSLALQVA
jgi:hypothetical protein